MRTLSIALVFGLILTGTEALSMTGAQPEPDTEIDIEVKDEEPETPVEPEVEVEVEEPTHEMRLGFTFLQTSASGDLLFREGGASTRVTNRSIIRKLNQEVDGDVEAYWFKSLSYNGLSSRVGVQVNCKGDMEGNCDGNFHHYTEGADLRSMVKGQEDEIREKCENLLNHNGVDEKWTAHDVVITTKLRYAIRRSQDGPWIDQESVAETEYQFKLICTR